MKWFLLLLVPLLGLTARAADVEVTVNGVDRPGGTLMIGFYKAADAVSFRVPGKAVPGSPHIEVVEAGTVTAMMEDLEPGVYAIAVIWDWNNNGKLDDKGRPFHIPTEPYGFSNNPSTRFGPAKFEEAHFRVEERGGRLVIDLVHP